MSSVLMFVAAFLFVWCGLHVMQAKAAARHNAPEIEASRQTDAGTETGPKEGT